MYSRSLHFHQLSLEQLEPRLLLSGSADEISLGVPVTENITSGDNIYFKVYLESGHDLFVTLDSPAAETYDLFGRFGELPTLYSSGYDAKGDGGSGSDRALHVQAEKAGYFYLLVDARSSDDPGSFTILADTSVTNLTLGQPIQAEIAEKGDDLYYQVYLSAGQDLFVTLDNPATETYDLYGRFGDLPTRYSSGYDAKGDGGSGSDKALHVHAEQDGYFYVLVDAANSDDPGSFTILTDTSVANLTIGQPIQAEFAEEGDDLYYQVYLESGQDLFVTLDNPAAETYDLYARFGDLPTRYSSGYDTKGDGGSGSDKAVHVHAEQNGYFYILVDAANSDDPGSFTILADTSVANLTLGQSIKAEFAEEGDDLYYQVYLSAGQDLFVTLDNPASETYDLYGRFADLPTRYSSGYDAKGDGGSGSDKALHVQAEQNGYFYLLVDASNSDEAYSFTLTAKGQLPALELNTPVTATIVEKGDDHYYQFANKPDADLETFIAVQSESDRYELCLRTDELPTRSVYDAKSAYHYRADPIASFDGLDETTAYILLDADSSDKVGDYTLNVFDVPVINLGDEFEATIAAAGYNYYALKNQTNEPLMIFLNRQATQNTELYVSQDTLPQVQSYDYIGMGGLGGDYAVGVMTPEIASYYMMVSGTPGETFELSIKNELPLLIPDQTINNQIDLPGESKYFTLTMPEQGECFVNLNTDDLQQYDLYASAGELPNWQDVDETGIAVTTGNSFMHLEGTPGQQWYILVSSDSSDAAGSFDLICRAGADEIAIGESVARLVDSEEPIIYKFEKPNDDSLYFSVDGVSEDDISLYISPEDLDDIDGNFEIVGIPGMGAAKTAILNYLSPGDYYAIITPNETVNEFEINLFDTSPAQTKIDLAENAMELGKGFAKKINFLNELAQPVSVSYSGPGKVSVLLEGDAADMADIDTILLSNDFGSGNLKITSKYPIGISNIFSESSSLKNLQISAPSFTGDVWLGGNIKTLNLKGDIQEESDFAVMGMTQKMNLSGDMNGQMTFGRIPAALNIKGNLAGDISGIGNMKANIKGDLSGAINLLGDSNLKVGGQLSGTFNTLTGSNLSFDSISPIGMGFVVGDVGNLTVTGRQRRGGFEGSIIVGYDINSVKMPKVDLDGWIYANGNVNSITSNGIGSGQLTIGGYANTIRLGTTGLNGLLNVGEHIDTLMSKGDLNGTILARDGINMLKATDIEHLNLFSTGGINNLQLGRGALYADGFLVTGEPIDLPMNLDFAGTMQDFSTINMASINDLLDKFVDHIDIPFDDPIVTDIGNNIENITGSLGDVFDQSWDSPTFQDDFLDTIESISFDTIDQIDSPWQSVGPAFFEDYQPIDAAYDIIEVPISTFVTHSLGPLGAAYNIIKASSSVADLVTEPPTLGSYIGGINGMSTLAGYAVGGSAGAALAAPVGLWTAMAGATVSANLNVYNDAMGIADQMLNASKLALTTGNDAYVFDAIDQFDSWNVEMNRIYNPDIYDNFGTSSGGINWDNYYDDLFGNYHCDYGYDDYNLGSTSFSSYNTSFDTGYNSSFSSFDSSFSSGFGSSFSSFDSTW